MKIDHTCLSEVGPQEQQAINWVKSVQVVEFVQFQSSRERLIRTQIQDGRGRERLVSLKRQYFSQSICRPSNIDEG